MSKERKIRVLVVEDSSAGPGRLAQILAEDAAIQVVSAAQTGHGVLQFLARHAADVVLLDVESSKTDSFETTQSIMETRPVPIVLCNGQHPHGSTTLFRLMEAGAVACVEKPPKPAHQEFDQRCANLVRTVKLMSEIKVVHRWPRSRRPGEPEIAAASPERPDRSGPVEVVGIGASTGGPPVLQAILAALPRDFRVPILIVQHIAPGFLGGLVEWLSQTTGMKIHIGAHHLRAQGGHVYIAPDGFHMGIDRSGLIELSREGPENGLRPAVNHLFRSLADGYGPRAIGVLLTGMGRDGADEMKRMHEYGAVTIAQDQQSAVINGMPGEAIALGAVDHVLPPDKIATVLVALTQRQAALEGARS